MSGFASLDDARLYYELAGEGPLVVLVHGFGLDCGMWDSQFARLAPLYQVLRYDLRGFGRSSVPEGRPYRHADDLAALLAHLALSAPAVVVGLSLGGWVALSYVLLWPNRVRALVLADAYVGGWRFSPEYRAEMAEVWGAAPTAGLDAARARWLGSSLFHAARAHPQAGAECARLVAGYSGWHFLNTDPERTAGAVDRLAEVQTPALVMVGERDVPDFQAISAALGRMPRARLVVLPGAGHMVNLEAPDHFNALLLAFLDEVNH